MVVYNYVLVTAPIIQIFIGVSVDFPRRFYARNLKTAAIYYFLPRNLHVAHVNCPFAGTTNPPRPPMHNTFLSCWETQHTHPHLFIYLIYLLSSLSLSYTWLKTRCPWPQGMCMCVFFLYACGYVVVHVRVDMRVPFFCVLSANSLCINVFGSASMCF